MKKILMSRGADKVVSICVKVQPGEEAVAAAVYRVGAHPILTIMEPREQDSQEPPRTIAAAMKTSDAFISIVGKSITHTNAVKEATQNGNGLP